MLAEDDRVTGLTVDNRAVVFVKDKKRLNIDILKPKGVVEVMFFGLPKNEAITLTTKLKTERHKTNNQGVLVLKVEKQELGININ